MARSWSDKLFGSRKNDKWRPDKWDKKKRDGVNAEIDKVVLAVEKFKKSMEGNETWAALDYDDLLTQVERLYVDCELEELAKDRQRRQKEVKEIVTRQAERGSVQQRK